MCLLQCHDVVALVGTSDVAGDTDTLGVLLTVVLQELVMLSTLPILDRGGGLQQDVAPVGMSLQVFVTQGNLTADTGLHCWTGLIQAIPTWDLGVLSVLLHGHKAFYNTRQLQVLLQGGEVLVVLLAHGTRVRSALIFLMTQSLADTLPAETVTATQRHRIP